MPQAEGCSKGEQLSFGSISHMIFYFPQVLSNTDRGTSNAQDIAGQSYSLSVVQGHTEVDNRYAAREKGTGYPNGTPSNVSPYITDDSAIGVSWGRQRRNTKVKLEYFPSTSERQQ